MRLYTGASLAVGDALKSHRQALGLTLDAAATTAGITTDRLARIEAGALQDSPRWEELSTLLTTAYNVPRQARGDLHNAWARSLVQEFLSRNSLQLRSRAGRCVVCACTDADCSACIEATGSPCQWVSPSRILCSRCADELVTQFAQLIVSPDCQE